MQEQPNYTRSNNEMHALLSIEQNKLDMVLQNLYYSPYCQYFYLLLLLFTFALFVATLFTSSSTRSSHGLIFIEFLLNLIIVLDFVLKVKLVGVSKFFTCQNKWNIFDTVVVIVCVIVFFIMVLSRQGKLKVFEEVSE